MSSTERPSTASEGFIGVKHVTRRAVVILPNDHDCRLEDD